MDKEREERVNFGKMLGLVLKDFGHIAVDQIERRQVPSGSVEIKVSHTGICGSDVHGFTGENGRRFAGQVMGHESEGTISTIGMDVDPSRFAIGQRVTFNPVVLPQADLESFAGREQHSPNKYVVGVRPDYPAAFAEYVIVPASNVVLLDSEIAPGAGALVEPLAVAVHAVQRANLGQEDKVLVIGGGPIGQSIVLALRQKGIKSILVSEPDEARRELVGLLGAGTVNPRQSEQALPLAIAQEFGEPPAVVFDAVGLSETVNAGLSALTLGGTLCLVGMGSPALSLEAYAVTVAERTIVGSFTYTNSAFEEAAQMISDAGAKVELLIGEVVGLEKAPDMFGLLAAGEGPAGKVLISFESIPSIGGQGRS